ncbi:MAG: hypothetical protein KDC35_06780 [Acidobacteria bacterium]|nr:hypothetical protein [Acidobacteriota bacterium]
MPLAIAHRGDSIHFPENTLLAFQAAWDLGVDAIELDVQMSADGTLVVFHDRNLKRMTGNTRSIDQVNWTDLCDLDVGSWFSDLFRSARIPRLIQVLESSPCTLLLEIKPRAHASHNMQLAIKLADLLMTNARWSEFPILCYDDHLLRAIHANHPQLKMVLNRDRGALIRDDQHLHGYSFWIGALTENCANRVKARNKQLYTFTCNSDDELHLARTCGAHGIMSDDPGWLQAELVS